MFENLIEALRTMRKRGIFLTILGAALSMVSFYNHGLELIELPTEMFGMIAVVFFLFGLIIAVHNTNSLAPMIFSFRYTKAKLFSRKKLNMGTMVDPDDEDHVSIDDGGFHYELYSDYLRDRTKWSGMSGSFLLAAMYTVLAIVSMLFIL